MKLTLPTPAIPLVLSLLGAASPGLGAPFVNLGFDDGSMSYDEDGWGYASFDVGMPGWQLGGPDGVYFGSGYVMNHIHVGGDFWAILRGPPGQFSFELKVGPLNTDDDLRMVTSIHQVGDIPADAHYLLMDSPDPGWQFQPPQLGIYFNDTRIPMFAVGNGQFAGDVSSLAGKTLELRIEVPIVSDGAGFHLDNLRFSPIPEPATTAGVLGCALLCWAAVRRKVPGSRETNP